MTASENCYARAFPKIIPSRYPSRTLRVPFATARFLTQLEIADILSPWKLAETLLETWQRFWSDLSLSRGPI